MALRTSRAGRKDISHEPLGVGTVPDPQSFPVFTPRYRTNPTHRYLAAGLLCGASLFALAHEACGEEAPSFGKPLAVYTAAAAVDFGSTRYLTNHGGREAWLPTQVAATQGAIKVGAALALAGADYGLQKSGHKTLAKVARIVVPAFWIGASIHNLKVSR